MKEYTGIHAVGDSKAAILVREPGIKSPRILVKHFNGDFTWGKEGKNNLGVAKSILLDAFGTQKCVNKKCKCENQWITNEHIESFAEKYIGKYESDETFKISQLVVCDFVFDINLMYNDIKEELDKIKVPETV